MFVIGTAGHVDHGKSALVEALTGTNPDRLSEEQERGLTIELGFAWLTLPSGREVSIVDVPGHVRFVRHMLAGVGAIDLALFVVAADESVMPQTLEHLEILDLLGVEHGVVAITKSDLVDADWLDLVEDEVRTLLEPTSLADAPVVRVSAVTGDGLDELRETLDAALDQVPEPRDIGRPRIGIDRVFTMTGFGTVVTGTLLDGRLSVGDSVEAVPDGPTARIRGLQTHRTEREEAEPGTRVAVNLAGLSTDELQRGQVLAPAGRLTAARAIDARVRVLGHRPLRHNLRVAVHAGAAEVQGRVRVLGSVDDLDGSAGIDEVAAGAEGWCQVVLNEPLAVVPGDLFVLRVSDQTVAGGRVIEVNPPRHRRTDGATVERLATRAAGTPESAVLAALERLEPCLAATIEGDVELDAEAFAQALSSLVEAGSVVALAAGEESIYLTSDGLARLGQRAADALETYEQQHPLRFAMPREELRSRLALDGRDFGAVLDSLAPAIAAAGEGVAREGWEPQLTAAQRTAADEIVTQLVAAGAAPPRLEADAELIAYLEGAGRAVDCGDGVVMAAEAYEQAVANARERLRAGPATLGEMRDALGTNRRAAQALLEMLDRRGITRREGDARVLREGS
ncbi:MAG TPA: selenocysteine-specific translation elongation factor [Dehalococcoidia bacterium]|nr:selenocysteine-specific translation elongation factor [Dehalococcoidia bacterium]